MLAYTRRNAAIATSVGAMVASIMLLIFFGAWAVSASSDSDVSGVLAGATAGFTGNVSARSQPVVNASAAPSDNVPRLASAASGETPADTWWGKALLGACPLH